jgi:hypothetical protein
MTEDHADEALSRAERAGRNQALFREVNEQIASVYEAQDAPTDFLQFVCECIVPDCHEHVSLTHGEYERVRAHPRRFVVKPEHVSFEMEHVVAESGQRYAVVEKTGEAGEVAEREANGIR